MEINQDNYVKEIAVATSKFRPIADIMKDPESRKRLISLVDYAVTIKQEIAKKQDELKQNRSLAADDLKIDPKLFNAYVSMAYNSSFMQKKQATEEQLDLIEYALMLANDSTKV